MPPTRTTGDEATPMEVDYIGKVGKGKKGLKGKGKGKTKERRKGSSAEKMARVLGKEQRKGRASGTGVGRRKESHQRKEEKAQRVGPAISVATWDTSPKSAGKESIRLRSNRTQEERAHHRQGMPGALMQQPQSRW